MTRRPVDAGIAASKRRAGIVALAIAVVASGAQFAIQWSAPTALPATVASYAAILAAVAAVSIAAASMVGRGPRLVALVAIAVAVAPAVALIVVSALEPNAWTD